MMIFGIPVVAILGTGLTALGAYNASRFVVAKHLERKRERAEWLDVREKIETVVQFGSETYAALKNPETRAAQAKKLSDAVKLVIEAGKTPASETVGSAAATV